MIEDLRYVVDLINRINHLKKDGVEIPYLCMEGEYSLWSFQQHFLLSQIKEYSKTKNFSEYRRKRTPRHGFVSRMLIWAFQCVVLCVTCIGIVSIFFRRVTIVTFSSDFLNADKKPTPRLRNIYNFFNTEKISFLEILHVTSMASFFKNLPKREHPGVYFESFSVCAQIYTFFRRRKLRTQFLKNIDYSSLSAEELPLVKTLLVEAVERTESLKVTTQIYAKFLKWTGAKAFVSVDDFRYVPDIMLACERVGIPTHVFQHSNFGFLPGMYQLPPQMYIFPTHFYTWNAYWERRVKEISPYFNQYGSRIQIGGRSFTPLQPPIVERQDPDPGKNTLTVLVPYEVSLPHDYIAPYITAMLDDGRITIYFVLRGTIDQIDPMMQVMQYVPESYRDHPRFIPTRPADRENAIRSCDVIAGVYSGFLDESVETGVPVAIFKTPFLHVNRLDTDNLATLIDIDADTTLFDQLHQAYMTPNALLLERRSRVTENTRDIREILQGIVG